MSWKPFDIFKTKDSNFDIDYGVKNIDCIEEGCNECQNNTYRELFIDDNMRTEYESIEINPVASNEIEWKDKMETVA